MRESRTYGSVRGARDETRVPTATSFALRQLMVAILPITSAECFSPSEPWASRHL